MPTVKLYTATINIGDKFLWHDSGWWGNPTVAYIGPNFVSTDRGGRFYFDHIVQGVCRDYEELGHCLDTGKRIKSTGFTEVPAYTPEAKASIALQGKLKLLPSPKERRTRIRLKMKKRTHSREFANSRIHSNNDFKAHCIANGITVHDVSLEKIQTQWYASFNLADIRQLYPIPRSIEEKLDACYSDELKESVVDHLLVTFNIDLLLK